MRFGPLPWCNMLPPNSTASESDDTVARTTRFLNQNLKITKSCNVTVYEVSFTTLPLSFQYLNLEEQVVALVPVAFMPMCTFTHLGAMIDMLSKTTDYK